MFGHLMLSRWPIKTSRGNERDIPWWLGSLTSPVLPLPNVKLKADSGMPESGLVSAAARRARRWVVEEKAWRLPSRSQQQLRARSARCTRVVGMKRPLCGAPRAGASSPRPSPRAPMATRPRLRRRGRRAGDALHRRRFQATGTGTGCLYSTWKPNMPVGYPAIHPERAPRGSGTGLRAHRCPATGACTGVCTVQVPVPVPVPVQYTF